MRIQSFLNNCIHIIGRQLFNATYQVQAVTPKCRQRYLLQKRQKLLLRKAVA